MKIFAVPVCYFVALVCAIVSAATATFTISKNGGTATLSPWKVCYGPDGNVQCYSISSDNDCSTEWSFISAIRGLSIVSCIDLAVALGFTVYRAMNPQGATRFEAVVRRFGSVSTIILIAYLGVTLAWWFVKFCDSDENYKTMGYGLGPGAITTIIALVACIGGVSCEYGMTADDQANNNNTNGNAATNQAAAAAGFGNNSNNNRANYDPWNNNNNDQRHHVNYQPQGSYVSTEMNNNNNDNSGSVQYTQYTSA